ncbi:MAG: LLM class flavin-dependent oxidoreductase [Dehalococcoidia bacterium]|nr:LLM class flavin-dependent oxidoreductase [Dehalococcoidia bacterium]
MPSSTPRATPKRSGWTARPVGDGATFYGGDDGLITLAAMAAVTSSIELKTSVYLLPLRHPVPVALQCAQIDQLSMGRLVLGIGIGGEDPHEFTSCGVDPRTRGARANEALEILRRLWTEDGVSFTGRALPARRGEREPEAHPARAHVRRRPQ